MHADDGKQSSRSHASSSAASLSAVSLLAGHDDCSCGIAAILESRASKRPGSASTTSATVASNSTQSTGTLRRLRFREVSAGKHYQANRV